MIKTKSLNILISFSIILSIPFVVSAANVGKINESNLAWSEGNVYQLTPTSNMATEGNYTIKAIDFPAPVLGRRTVNDTIIPDKEVVPFVSLELYYDIVNNSNPIASFSLGIGDYYISDNQEIKISLDDIPGSLSQDWVYEYYNPWANIKIQKRGIPNLNIDISFKDLQDNDIDRIKSGDTFKTEIKIKNTGDDKFKDMVYTIVPDPTLTVPSPYPNQKLSDTIYSLDKDEEKDIELIFKAPITIEEKQYNISVYIRGYDIKDIPYNFSNSNGILKNDITGSIYLNKSTLSTYYMKDTINVVLSIVNYGITMTDIKINDSIPDDLVFVDNISQNNSNSNGIIINVSSIKSGESYTYRYKIKPVNPGIFILPKFDINFVVNGKSLNMSSNEDGFRVFGPKLIINKTILNRGKYLEVQLDTTNTGNGYAKVILSDQIPDNFTLLSGKTNLTSVFNAQDEKILTYNISTNRQGALDLNSINWPMARADYYMDNENKFTSYSQLIINNKIQPIVSETPAEIKTNPENVAVTQDIEKERQVVATIPPKGVTEQKSSPGFETISIMIVISLLILKKKMNKR